MKRNRLSIAKAAALSTAVIWSAAFSEKANAAQPQFMGLGDLPGGGFLSIASDVSADGSVVVGSSVVGTGRLNCCRGGPVFVTLRNAFRWTEQRGMVALGTLSDSNLANSSAVAISADGSTVVGNSGVYSNRGHFRPEITLTNDAFRWRSGPGMVGLGTDTTSANAASANGRVVVGNRSSSSGSEAFLWRQDAGMTGLGDLPGGAFASFANGVSNDGQVVVGYSNSEAGNEAYRWTQETGMVGLGDFTGGAFASFANDESADGSVVVGYGTTDAGSEAFRWTESTGLVGLGDLPGGAFASIANDVSADGSVAVGYGTSDKGNEAFVWDGIRGMRNLRDLLVNRHGLGDSLTGWTLTTATGVSADGEVIVGFGRNASGAIEAWRARLGPEPLLLGDFNHDGRVDAADYVVWRKTDRMEERYQTWRANFGRTSGFGATAAISRNAGAVPEPASLALFLSAATGLLTPRRRFA